jgi:hypothetical protein
MILYHHCLRNYLKWVKLGPKHESKLDPSTRKETKHGKDVHENKVAVGKKKGRKKVFSLKICSTTLALEVGRAFNADFTGSTGQMEKCPVPPGETQVCRTNAFVFSGAPAKKDTKQQKKAPQSPPPGKKKRKRET